MTTLHEVHFSNNFLEITGDGDRCHIDMTTEAVVI